jgi:dihydrolipoamide dehydrogenase
MAETFDMVVIGGGPGGYVAALKGRRLGMTVALAEKDRVGGVCLNRGCIPTKALLADAEGLQWVHRAARDGLIAPEPIADFSRMSLRMKEIVSKMVSNLEILLKDSGVRLLRGAAEIPEPGTVRIGGGGELKARNTVLATGSRSWKPPIAGADLPGVLTTRELLDFDRVPKRLLIIGGGFIGMEFATVFSTVGSKVTVLEVLGRLLNEVDGEMARKFTSLLPARGISAETGVHIQGIEAQGNGLRVVYQKRGQEKTAEADVILMATGRRPNVGELHPESFGVRVTGGAIEVNEFLETSAKGIFAVGDVIGRKMLAHAAYHHGEIAADNIAGLAKPVQDDVVPACVFTSPQIAWVGLTEEQASSEGRPFRSSTFSLSQNGKAQAMGEPRGWIKLIEDTKSGRLVGAHLLGPHVSELIGELALAVRLGLAAKDIAETIHAHPTLSESIREAALGLLDGSLHGAARIKSSS